MKDQDQPGQRSLTRRAALLGGGQLLLFGALGARMYYLQVVEASRYQKMAEDNRINVRLLAPRRGRILDRFGVPLAINQQNYRVVLTADQAGDIESTLDAIGDLIPVSDNDRRKVLRDTKRKHSFVPVVVRDNIAWEEVARIEVNVSDLPGVSIEVGSSRAYPFGDRVSHLVGYVAPPAEDDIEDDPLFELPDFRIGKSGLEQSQEDDLRGGAGNQQVEVNALGRVVREIARDDGMPGEDVVSTIDMSLQDFVQHRIASEEAASCVVMDSVTGDVLVMASSPAYDSNSFTQGLSTEVWNQLNNDPHGPLYNKTTQGVYPPGSTFKPCVAMTALQSGIITPDFQVVCTGEMQLGTATFHCWQHDGHGTLDLHGAIKNSCDIYFYELARRIGIDRLSEMAHRLGLGQQTGVDLPSERSGLVPSREWKRKKYGASWTDGETLNVGIGQGAVTATPIQLATMLCRILTNRAVTPRVVREAGVIEQGQAFDPDLGADDFGSLDFTDSYRAAVLSGMDAVVNDPGGTAFGARITEDGMAMGGKSGSAQVRSITAAERLHGALRGDLQNAIPWKERDHALFIAFAPVGNPRYVCTVVVEHAIGGSKVAAPIARDVLRECQKRDPARRYPPAGDNVADASGGALKAAADPVSLGGGVAANPVIAQ